MFHFFQLYILISVGYICLDIVSLIVRKFKVKIKKNSAFRRIRFGLEIRMLKL